MGGFRIKSKLLIGIVIILILISLLIIIKTGNNITGWVIKTEDKINPEIKKEIKENPEKELDVIIQIKEDKEKVKNNIKNLGKVEDISDNKLVAGKLKAKDIETILSSEVVKIWPDRQTFLVLDNSVEQINADNLWNQNYNGSGIKIAVLDTGINKQHEMFQDRVILEQDFTNSNDANDNNGHGTHVAGIIAGSGKYTGVAPAALLLNGKVLDNNGYGQLSWLINGIDWAIANNADIISLSLGASYSGNPEDLLDAPEVLKVKEAVNKGIVVVIASGNCGNGCGSFYGVTTPGITKEVITVGAVDDDNLVADFSSGDSISNYIKPDLTAPGVNICSSFLDSYECLSGTSMSTPHVSGGVALLLEKNNELNPYEVKLILENGALDLGDSGKDVRYGSGLIDLSNLEEVIIEVEKENYELIIPVFEVGIEDEIVLIYNNTLDKKKFRIVFDLEELDYDFSEEFKKTIKNGEIEEFRYNVKLELSGKHLLKVDIYIEDELVESIERVVDVGSDVVYEDRLAGVNLR